MDSNALNDKLLLDMHQQTGIIREHIAGIQTDIKEHIRRTNIIEAELKWVQRQIWVAHGAILIIGAIFGALKWIH